MGKFQSPTGVTYDFVPGTGQFGAAPNGVLANFKQGQSPDIGVITIPATANYNDTTAPLKIPTPPGLLVYVRNLQATPVLVVGPRTGDPGALISAGAVELVGTDDNNGAIVIGGSGGSGSAGLISVAILSDLTGLNDGALADGELAYVRSRRAYCTLLKSSTAALVTGQIVATQSGTGRWVRLIDASVGTWASPNNTTVTIDPVNGNDDNDGTVNPLATFAEVRARGYYANAGANGPEVRQNITVFVNSATLGEDLIVDVHTPAGSSAIFRVVGLYTIARSGSFTAFTARNAATNTPNNGADGANPFTNADIGKFIHITSGANSGVFALILSVSAGTARFSTFMKINGATQNRSFDLNPSNGDTYDVVTPTLLGTSVFSVSQRGPGNPSGNTVIVEGFQYNATFPNFGPSFNGDLTGPTIVNCILGTAAQQQFANGSAFTAANCLCKPSLARFAVIQGGGCIGDVGIFPDMDVTLRNGYLVQGGTIHLGKETVGPFSIIGTFASLNLEDCGIFDWASPGAGVSGAAVDVFAGGTVSLIPNTNQVALWGTSANASTFVFDISAGKVVLGIGGGLTWATAVVAQGASHATKDFQIRGNATSFAFDRVAAAFVAPAINNTFALLDTAVAGGGFGGATIDPASGDGLSQAVL